jgi:hypothetical protein
MIFAAKTTRKYWEIAGTWLEIERAEYRLAMTYLAAGDLNVALSIRLKLIGLERCDFRKKSDWFFN